MNNHRGLPFPECIHYFSSFLIAVTLIQTFLYYHAKDILDRKTLKIADLMELPGRDLGCTDWARISHSLPRRFNPATAR
jgi:hypothetical protein